MKKFFFAVLCTLGLVATASAQDTFRKGDNVLNVGIGLSNFNTTSLPPISAMYERSVLDGIIEDGAIGLGLQGEVTAYKGAGLGLFVGPRVAFHYEFVENLDTYVGVQAGLGLVSSHVGFDVDGVLGARYYLGEKWGVFGEFGTGFSVFKVGINFRL